MEKNVMISIRTTDTMKERLEQVAEQRDIPLSQLLREIIKNYLGEV